MSQYVYRASDIQKALGVGKTMTYRFLNEVSKEENPPFRVFKVGTTFRIHKKSFDEWFGESIGCSEEDIEESTEE